MKGTYRPKFYLWILSATVVIGMMWLTKMTASAESEWIRERYQTNEDISAIVVEETGMSVIVQTGQTDAIVVEYSTLSTENLYAFSVSNNTLTIKKTRKVGISINDEFTGIPANYGALVITLPQKQFESILIQNPSNGSATLENINSKMITAELTTGTIKLIETHSQNIFAETRNGGINLDQTNSVNYQCRLRNGQIIGTIVGDKSDYSIVASVRNGTNNLTNQITDGKSCSIEFEVRTGHIEVQFVK